MLDGLVSWLAGWLVGSSELIGWLGGFKTSVAAERGTKPLILKTLFLETMILKSQNHGFWPERLIFQNQLFSNLRKAVSGNMVSKTSVDARPWNLRFEGRSLGSLSCDVQCLMPRTGGAPSA